MPSDFGLVFGKDLDRAEAQLRFERLAVELAHYQCKWHSAKSEEARELLELSHQYGFGKE